MAGTVTITVPSAYALTKSPTVPSLVPMPAAMSGRRPAGIVSIATRMNPMSASEISAGTGRREPCDPRAMCVVAVFVVIGLSSLSRRMGARP